MKKKDIFIDGKDCGYLDNQNWWFDPTHPDSFEIFELDGFYPADYFNMPHVSLSHQSGLVDSIVEHIKRYYRDIAGRELHSVFEMGCGGGWFTKRFIDCGIEVVAVEGTKYGYELALKNGISPNVIMRHDLRRSLNLNRKFDLCCCTEVAEHIEAPFSSQLVNTATMHSDMVWFSSEPPGTNQSHYHHCNEQPEKFWINLFDFYGFDCIKLPEELAASIFGRGTHIFVKKDH